MTFYLYKASSVRIPEDWSKDIDKAKRELTRAKAKRDLKAGSHGRPSAVALDVLHYIQCEAALRGTSTITKLGEREPN